MESVYQVTSGFFQDFKRAHLTLRIPLLKGEGGTFHCQNTDWDRRYSESAPKGRDISAMGIAHRVEVET